MPCSSATATSIKAAATTAGIPFIFIAGNHDFTPDYWTGSDGDAGVTYGSTGGANADEQTISAITSNNSYWNNAGVFDENISYSLLPTVSSTSPSWPRRPIATEGTTGIQTLLPIDNASKAESFYNLKGQKIAGPLKKGVYILHSADGRSDRKVIK
ncbi:MAG: hypothetical protein IJV34_03900 [Prevotella sp.]|nr:hypothetical protein [Prevotella sp.]